MTPFRWTAEHLALLASRPWPTAPVFGRADAPRVTPGLDLWDHWPVLEEDGRLAEVAGGLLVIALTAPILPDPDARHAVAHLRLLHRRGPAWRDLGALLPEGMAPGSREWAGSAVVDGSGSLRLFFTAAGERGEAAPSFVQRQFETSARLEVAGEAVRLCDWTEPQEVVRPDGALYETELAGGGRIGAIKAFRDPYVFRSPGDGVDHLLFTGSRARSSSRWNGLVGAARRAEDRWTLLAPIVDADGVNNELERPHAIVHDGRVYLFWSTQAEVFAPGLAGPTGLYGLVAERFEGPWRPLNRHGLVLANPAQAPAQAYSWQVLPDLQVWSFANLPGWERPTDHASERRAHFGGAPAPPLRLRLDDDVADLAP